MIAITGIGLTTSLGVGVALNWERLVRGETGLGPLTRLDVGDFPVRDGGEDPPAPETEEFSDGGPAPAPLRHLLSVCREALGGAATLPVAPERAGISIGSSLAADGACDAFFKSVDQVGKENADYSLLRWYNIDRHFRYLLDSLQVRGATTLVSNACAAGAGAVSRAASWLRTGRCDLAIATGYDAFSVFTFAGFGSLMALAENKTRPFAADRDGMKIGAGYAALVLEPLELACAAGRQPLAILSGYGESSDAHHLTHPHPEGLGASLAMRRALSMSGLSPDDIDVVNCHATATPSNDSAETMGMKTVFGSRLPQIPIYAPKPSVGHTLGGAGTVEALISVLFLQNQVIAPTLNVSADTVDPAFDVELDIVTEARPCTLRHVMSNSFGFGGSNASLILSRPEEEV